MSVVLVTGFGPFLDVEVNASGIVARAVAARGIPGVYVHAEVLPTAFGAARVLVKELVERRAPVAIVALGVSRDPFVRIERRAVGRVSSASPDSAGEVWADRTLGADLCAHPSIDRWIVDAQAIDPQIAVSDDAGGYVCNATYHAVLAAADHVPAAFVHIPRAYDDPAIDARVAVVRALVASMLA